MIDLLDGKDNEKLVPKYKKLSEHGESAKDIKNLKMLQYAFEDKTSTSTDGNSFEVFFADSSWKGSY